MARNEVAKVPLQEILAHHRRPLLIAIGLKISEISYASIAGVFVISYATGHLGLPRGLILTSLMYSSVVAIASIPFFGFLSDRVGPEGRCSPSVACSAWLLPSRCSGCWTPRTRPIITLTVVAAISFGQMVGFGIGAPWYSELFTARLRYSGASLGIPGRGGAERAG